MFVQLEVLGDEFAARNHQIPELQMRIVSAAAVVDEEEERCDAVPHFEGVHVHERAVLELAPHGAPLEAQLAKMVLDGRVDAAALEPLESTVESVRTDVVRLEVDGREVVFRDVQELQLQYVVFRNVSGGESANQLIADLC